MCCRQNSISSGLGRPAPPGLSVTNALGARPTSRPGSRRPRTPAPPDARRRACSTSIVEMFSPPEMMMSFFAVAQLDVAVRVPAPPRSPEWNQPPRNASAVASGLLVVALHHVVAAHDDLAERLAVARARRCIVLVHHAHQVGDRRSPGPGGPPGGPAPRRAARPTPAATRRRCAGRTSRSARRRGRAEAEASHLAEQRRRGRRAGDRARSPGASSGCAVGIVDERRSARWARRCSG